MSESAPIREWRFYVADMIGFAEKALAYTNGMNQAEFASTSLVFDATLRNLEPIGEAATHVPEVVRKQYPHLPWRRVVATRNRLIHGYLGLDMDTLWSIVTVDLPALLDGLRAIDLSPGLPSY